MQTIYALQIIPHNNIIPKWLEADLSYSCRTTKKMDFDFNILFSQKILVMK